MLHCCDCASVYVRRASTSCATRLATRSTSGSDHGAPVKVVSALGEVGIKLLALPWRFRLALGPGRRVLRVAWTRRGGGVQGSGAVGDSSFSPSARCRRFRMQSQPYRQARAIPATRPAAAPPAMAPILAPCPRPGDEAPIVASTSGPTDPVPTVGLTCKVLRATVGVVNISVLSGPPPVSNIMANRVMNCVSDDDCEARAT